MNFFFLNEFFQNFLREEDHVKSEKAGNVIKLLHKTIRIRVNNLLRLNVKNI